MGETAMHTGGMWSMDGPMWMPSQPPTLRRLLDVHLQPVPLLPVLGLLALLLYLAGVLALRRRGGDWPAPRLASWVAGIAVLEFVTTTGIEGYGMMVFSVHMVQHMVLAMVVPILLLLGSPVTLALRALPLENALRRRLVRLLASRFAAAILSLPVRWALFLASLYGIYFTPAFGTLMHSVWGHNVMLLHFLVTGWLFFGPLVSGRSGAPARLAETFASAPLHALFGLIILTAHSPVVAFFEHPDPTWSIRVLPDQSLAGGIAWAASETATVLVMAIVLVQWVRGRPRRMVSPRVPSGSAPG